MKTTIVITGGTGLIGNRLAELLPAEKYDLRILTRKVRPTRDNISYYGWDPLNGEIDISVFDACDFVITLAGAGIADKRWTSKRKKLIIDSRVKGNELIRTSLAKLNHRPKAIVSASAIGFYGDREDEILTESSAVGSPEFLTESTLAWENSIHRLDEFTERLCTIRIGIVLSTKGGALEKMLIPLNFGISGYFGNGSQYYSWIHIDDLCQLFITAIEDSNWDGIYNGVSPDPIPLKEFAKAIKNVKLPIAIAAPVPEALLKLAMGEMTKMLTNSTRVVPKRALDQGFEFQFTDLKPAVIDIIENEK